MNEKESSGCKELLEYLHTDELSSLTDTVTKKLIKVSTKPEALKAILTYSESACELLHRRKLKRDLLFKYLVDKGVVISVNADKRTIIRKLLETWGTKNINSQMKQYDRDLQSSSSSDSLASLPNPRQQSDIQQSNSSSLTVRSSHDSCLPTQPTVPELQLLGEQFATWFYRVLNSHNPHMGVTPEEFGPCHFYDEARLMLMILSSDEKTNDELSGSQFVSDRLLSFTKTEFLLFNPNISRDGVFVKTDRHGLVIVLVCGTIHRQNQHLGVFDQMFGLVKDPRFNDNYKIKLTKLKLHNTPTNHVPALKDRPESEIRDLVAV